MVRQGGNEATSLSQQLTPRVQLGRHCYGTVRKSHIHSWGQDRQASDQARTCQDRQYVTKQAQGGSHIRSVRHECSFPGAVASPSSPPQRGQPDVAVLELGSDEKPPPQRVSSARSPGRGMASPEETEEQAAGHSHFHLRKRNVPGNREQGKAWLGLSEPLLPPNGAQADLTDRLPLRWPRSRPGSPTSEPTSCYQLGSLN